MSSSLPIRVDPGPGPWARRRVETFVAVTTPDGGLITVASPGEPPRLPGAVLGHGEHPTAAIGRALRTVTPDLAIVGPVRADDLHLSVVHSGLRPGPESAGEPTELHVLTLVFSRGSERVIPVDPDLLRAPEPPAEVAVIPAGRPGPGEAVEPAAPRVQRPAAYALIMVEDHVLLSRLTNSSLWTLPGGGIDHGEHPDDAVRREVYEETGLTLTDAELVLADSKHFTGHSPLGVREDFHAVRFLYRGVVAGREEPCVQEVDGTTDAAAWVPLAELPARQVSDVVRVALSRLR